MSGTDRPSGKDVFRSRFADIYKKPAETCDAGVFIESWLDRNDGRGIAEEAQATASNVVEAFGRLIKIMFESDLLTKEEVERIAGLRS